MAQQCATMKARPLDKDEVVLLIDLIVSKQILTTKATNATNNRLKDVAWKTIAQEFSARSGEARRPEQLRLKWENLKKAARKRSAAIRQNNIKTGGGKSYIPQDEVLDRVASMLGATCSGFTVEFGGDKEDYIVQTNGAAEVAALPDFELEPTSTKDNNNVLLLLGDGSTNGGVGSSGGGISQPNYTPKKLIFNTPKNSLNKRRKLTEEGFKAEKEKNLALAAYFRAKTEKVELENLKLKLEIELLKKNIAYGINIFIKILFLIIILVGPAAVCFTRSYFTSFYLVSPIPVSVCNQILQVKFDPLALLVDKLNLFLLLFM